MKLDMQSVVYSPGQLLAASCNLSMIETHITVIKVASWKMIWEYEFVAVLPSIAVLPIDIATARVICQHRQ